MQRGESSRGTDKAGERHDSSNGVVPSGVASSSSSYLSSKPSSHAPRQSLRDRVAANLHEHLPSLSLSGRISVRIRNETSCPVQIVAWPKKIFFEDTNTQGDDADLELSTHRGTAWEGEVVPPDTILPPNDGAEVEIASMRKAHSYVLRRD